MIQRTVTGLDHCLSSALSSWQRTLPTMMYPVHLSETELEENTDTSLEHSERMDESLKADTSLSEQVWSRWNCRTLAERSKNKMPRNPTVLPKQTVTSSQARWTCSPLSPKVALNLPLTVDGTHPSILVERVSVSSDSVRRYKKHMTQKII